MNYNTWHEITGQVGLWEDSARRALVANRRLGSLLTQRDSISSVNRVLLSGAGSSHYIGLCLESLWRNKLEKCVEVCSSTDLTAIPYQLLTERDNALLVSFSRSGGSPESIGAFNLVNQICNHSHHTVVTCSATGKLAECARRFGECAFLVSLDEATADKALAMTSSFTNMLIAGQALVCSDIPVDSLIHAGQSFLERSSRVAKEISQWDFCRAVFLGDGPFFGVAKEAALKLQELTDGTIMTMAETFMGLRHGPLAAIDENTLVVYFTSNNDYTFKYERDLIEGVRAKQLGCKTVAIGQAHVEEVSRLCDAVVPISQDAGVLPDLTRPPVDVIFGQLLGFFKSISYGLNPDEPSRQRKAISRVVDGVKLYELTQSIGS